MGLLSGRSNGNHISLRSETPRAREYELVIEEFGEELLVYDSEKKLAHSLGASATRVWRACDGSTSVEAIAEQLDISEAEVRDAVAQLDDLNLLESGITVMQSDEVESGITRRQMTMRSVKAGAAVVTAPLIYSINVSPALATITPTPFQCEVFSVRSCGASTGCGSIFGCCCCCSGNGSCKTCGAVAFCNAGNQPCAPLQGGGFGSTCSDHKGTNPADPRGCCGIAGSDNCGCGFGPFAGCCDPTTGTSCTPGGANCFPCCNGNQLQSSSTLGCCKSATVDCCAPGAPSCCAKSSQTVDCCGPNPAACCGTAQGCGA